MILVNFIRLSSLLILGTAIIMFNSCSSNSVKDKKEKPSSNTNQSVIINNWSEEKEKQHLSNRQDSSTWDYEMLDVDIRSNKERSSKPFNFGAFPVPKYSLLGENIFKGIGVGSTHRKVENSDNNVYCTFFFVNNNELIKQYIPKGKENEIFFVIMVLSDVKMDTINYSHSRNHMISRNNPDYIGQGFVETKNGDIDYMAFLTADRNEYAIVNMRLFNLKHGRIVVIAPQKDTSIRSLQLKSEQTLSTDDIENYIDEIIKQKTVINFLSNKGNI